MGPSGGRPLAGWGRQWMNAKLPRSHRPESEFISRKYPISLLLHRIESVIRDVAWRPLFLPFLGTTTHQHTVMYIPNQANPHAFACCSAACPAICSGAALRARVCTALCDKTHCKPDQKLGASFTPDCGQFPCLSWGILRNGRLSWRRMLHQPRTGE